MNRSLLYRFLFILFIIGFAVVLILPTVGMRKMEVRLDKSITTDQINFIKSRFPADKYRLQMKEDSLEVEGYGLNDAVMNDVRSFPGVANAELVKHWAEKVRFIRAKKINLGLDLQGGMQLVLMPNFETIEKRQGKKLSDSEKSEMSIQALELLRNRVDQFGVSEPSLRKRESGAIEVQLPGVKDPAKVKKLIGTTGRVEYRIANDEYSAKANEWIKANFKEPALPETKETQSDLLSKVTKAVNLPVHLEFMFFYERVPNSRKIFPSHVMALEKAVSLAGDDINKAYVGYDEMGRLAVHFTTTADGAKKFSDATSKKNHGKKLAIVIDNKVRSAPNIGVQITTGQALIQGDFSREEVDTLTSIIKEGALPVDLEKIEERSVGPSLGIDSINSGIKALMLAFVIIVVFIIIYYKASGMIASLGLILNFIFMIAMLSWLNFTLTMPGIAGFVLTIGMAVDANVIIYERIKEEIKAGKSVKLAISAGFERAFWTIFDSNLTTLIAAFILSQFGTGPIKGFAVTLSIGILCSMFVSLYITKFIYEVISQKSNLKKLSI